MTTWSNDDGHLVIREASGRTIWFADIREPDEPEQRARATEVVRAMNAFDAMREALEAVLNVWHNAHATRADDEAAENKARAALANAEGE